MILMFTDLHLDNYRRFSTTLSNGLNSRLYEQVKVFDHLLTIVKEEKPDAIVFLGDLFNGQGASINKQLYSTGFKLFEKLQENTQTIIVVGNHDSYAGQHILAPFSALHNVSVVSETAQMTLDGHDITFIPWCGVIPKSPGIAMGHLDVEGGTVSSGDTIIGTIHPQELETYKKVFSGHWHSKQTMLNGKIEYIGEIMQNSFGDMFNTGGITLLNRDLSTKFIEINSPRFIVVDIQSSGSLHTFLENRSSENYYKLIVNDRKIPLPKFDHHVEIEWNIIQEVKTRLENKEESSLEETVERFIKGVNTKINKEKAIRLMQEIMKEV